MLWVEARCPPSWGATPNQEKTMPSLLGHHSTKSCAASLCLWCFFLSTALSYYLLTSVHELPAGYKIHARCLGALVIWLEENSSVFLITTTSCTRHIRGQLRTDCLQNCGRVVVDISA